MINPSIRGKAWRAGALSISVLVLTALHHAYGAAIYDTPWRLHVLHFVVPSAVAIALSTWLAIRITSPVISRSLLWFAAAISFVVPIGLMGFFEGGFNHVLKNVVHFLAGEHTAQTLYQSSFYDTMQVEMPNDFIFELTGVAQFPLAVMAAVATVAMIRATLARRGVEQS